MDLAVDPPQVFTKLTGDRTNFAVTTDMIGIFFLQKGGQNLDEYAYTKPIALSSLPITFSKT